PRPKPLTFWQKILKAIGLYKDPAEAKSPKHKNADTGKVSRSGGPVAGNKGSGKKETRSNKSSTPTVVESTRLYVGNLSYEASEYDLEELFKGIGSVRKVELVYNRRTHKSKGYGFLTMGALDEAKRAVEVLHDQPFMGRRLIVNGARSTGPAEGDAEGIPRDPSKRQSTPAQSESKIDSTNIPEEEEVHSLAPQD
ncbi:MAG: RNA-binding protein, partial [Verrucomicrobiota bacterium]